MATIPCAGLSVAKYPRKYHGFPNPVFPSSQSNPRPEVQGETHAECHPHVSGELDPEARVGGVSDATIV